MILAICGSGITLLRIIHLVVLTTGRANHLFYELSYLERTNNVQSATARKQCSSNRSSGRQRREWFVASAIAKFQPGLTSLRHFTSFALHAERSGKMLETVYMRIIIMARELAFGKERAIGKENL